MTRTPHPIIFALFGISALALTLASGCSRDADVAVDPDAGVGNNLPDGAMPDIALPDGGAVDGGGGMVDGGDCVDADDDGVTDCGGDCDDADPLTYPGAAEICGDGVDNACGSNPDPASLCMAIGTFVSEAGSDATGDGTRDNPVRTIAQGIQNGMTIGGAQTVVIAGGTYTENVTMVEGVSLRGGFACDALPCAWGHDPANNETVVDGGATGNTFEALTGLTRATRLDDLTIRTGGTAILMNGGSLALRRVSIDARQGVLSYGGSDPLIEECVVVTTGSGITLDDDGDLLDSDIVGSPAVSTRGPSLVRNNMINAAGETGIWLGGDTRVESNVINEDASRVGTCSFGFCSGAAIWGGSPVLTNNVIYGMGGAKSAAIAIFHGELFVDEPRIHSNTLYVARTATAGSINAGVSCESVFGLAMFGELRNNIVIGASSGSSFGYYEEDHDPGRTCRPVLVENNLFFDIDHVARFYGTPETLFTSVADADAETWAASNLAGDPMLDASHRLMSGSPAIDTGTATMAPATDREGTARPSGAGFDIGADER